MKLSKRNVFVGIGGIVLLMLVTNPSRRHYLDVKSGNTVIAEQVAESICKTSSRVSRNISESDQCKSEVIKNQTSIEQFLANNYRRRDFLVLSIHEVEILQSDTGRFRISTTYEDIGILGIFINSGVIILLGLMIVFIGIAGIAVLFVRFIRKINRPYGE